MSTQIHQASTSLYYLEDPNLNFAALILAIATIVALLGLRRTKSVGDEGSNRVLGITIKMGTLYGIGALIAGIAIAIREYFTSPITVPVEIHPGSLPLPDPPVDDPMIYELKLNQIHVTILDVSAAARFQLAVGALLMLAVHVILAYFIVQLASRLRDGQGIESRTITLAQKCAVAVAIAGTSGSCLRQLGSFEVARTALGTDHAYPAEWEVAPVIGQSGELNLIPPQTFGFAIPLWPFVAALAIAVVTILLRQHQEVVASRARLEEEVSGLV